MALPLEDYALLGDGRTAALVSRRGSIDWLCLPRLDSAACFAALVGSEENGFWELSPAEAEATTTRAYRRDSMVLETTHVSPSGEARVVEALVEEDGYVRLVRRVTGIRGALPMRMRIKLRFDYGALVPWVYRVEGGIVAIAGPDAVAVYSDVAMRAQDLEHVAKFRLDAGTDAAFELVWFPSHEHRPPDRCSALVGLEREDGAWHAWAQACRYEGPYREAVMRSLLVLKALISDDGGGIAAAPTTSLPEKLGGSRNWDYRYCWIRDAAFVLVALMNAGYLSEAAAWRSWLLRAVAGSPKDLQILYGLRGERRIMEWEASWLPGYGGAKPVRIGNAASSQFQLDVYGEMIDALYQARRGGIASPEQEWALACAVIEGVEDRWREPDKGLWEMRGPSRPFVYSKVQAWVALDRAVRAVESFGLDGPVDRWRAVRDEIHAEVCEKGFDAKRNTFTQSYGSKELDAASLLIPLVGFLKPDDPRVLGTIAAVERELIHDGFVRRYVPDDSNLDGLPPGEGAFIACNYWLVDVYAVTGRRDEGVALFERLLAIRNDVGLLSEEYSVKERRLVGNFPQAFSHVGLINSAFNLHAETKPAQQRGSVPAGVIEPP